MYGRTRAQEISSSIDTIIRQVNRNTAPMTPTQAADYALKLSTLLWDLGEEVAVANSEYFKVWKELRSVCATARDSEIESKATQQYLESQVFNNRKEALVEIINALKKKIGIVEQAGKNKY